MRYGKFNKIYINSKDEKEMVLDLMSIHLEDRELLDRIGALKREEYSNGKGPKKPSTILSCLRRGKMGFHVHEFVLLLRYYLRAFLGRYVQLLDSHPEYSELPLPDIYPQKKQINFLIKKITSEE